VGGDRKPIALWRPSFAEGRAPHVAGRACGWIALWIDAFRPHAGLRELPGEWTRGGGLHNAIEAERSRKGGTMGRDVLRGRNSRMTNAVPQEGLSLERGSPKKLFDGPLIDFRGRSRLVITNDGQRFIAMKPRNEEPRR